MSPLSVVAVRDAATAARTLTELRVRVRNDFPGPPPPSEASALRDLDRPHLRPTFLVAERTGGPVAFVAARLSPALTDADGRPLGMLGPFEATDADAATELLRAGTDDLRRRDAGEVIGPISGDTWHSYRLNVGPWEDPPFLLEPWNPPAYEGMWTAAGFTAWQGYHSKEIVGTAAAAEGLRPKREAAQARGYSFVPLREAAFEEELGRVYELSRVLFAGNPLYTEISRDEFLDLYRDARPLIRADCVTFAVAPDGSDAGFQFTLEDPAGTLNVKTLGVLAEHRRAGLGGALVSLAYQAAAARNVPLLLCLMHDNNVSSRIDGGNSRVMRRYRLYRAGGGPA